MSWHSKNRSTDGVQRIPADCMVWKHTDERWPEFAQEDRHLHLGLAMDGVNPFGQCSTTYSVWPVVVVNYNIPPWLTTKKGHLILSLLVPGRYKVKNMDVYLQPLVDELKELWSGIEVVDKIADAEPIETEVAELPDIDMTMPEDHVKPIEIEVAEMPEDDIVDLNDIDFSLGGELTVDLEVGIELCQDAVENT
ncbi:hypothetical protein L7F22_029490 [Adiantum nelumboides]|nr:hypothetical protein [Adiantum nelumboides]